jgi:hypothetical protein
MLLEIYRGADSRVLLKIFTGDKMNHVAEYYKSKIYYFYDSIDFLVPEYRVNICRGFIA